MALVEQTVQDVRGQHGEAAGDPCPLRTLLFEGRNTEPRSKRRLTISKSSAASSASIDRKPTSSTVSSPGRVQKEQPPRGGASAACAGQQCDHARCGGEAHAMTAVRHFTGFSLDRKLLLEASGLKHHASLLVTS